jgi:hypothetical protein
MKGVIICRGYGLDDSVRRFWSGSRWVVDPSDAELYQGTKWHADYHRLRKANTTDHDIVAVSNYGFIDEQTIKPRSVW